MGAVIGWILMLSGGTWFAWAWARTPSEPKPGDPVEKMYASMFWAALVFNLGLVFILGYAKNS